MRSSVLLPDPFGPSRAATSPRAMRKETSSTARVAPWYFVRCPATIISPRAGAPAGHCARNLGPKRRTSPPGRRLSARPRLAETSRARVLVTDARRALTLAPLAAPGVHVLVDDDDADAEHGDDD